MGTTLVLLPGLDGTGRLFAPLLAELPSWIEPLVLAYPAEPLGYADLVERLFPRLPTDRPFFILGESFGGPLALMLATRSPPGLQGVVLVCTFVRYPSFLPRAIARRLGALLALAPRPDFLVRQVLVGADAPRALLDALRDARSTVAPDTLARRIREGVDVDARRDLADIRVPILCISASADRLVPHRATDEIRSLRPDATYVELAAPHVLLARCPAEAVSSIATWLAAGGNASSR